MLSGLLEHPETAKTSIHRRDGMPPDEWSKSSCSEASLVSWAGQIQYNHRGEETYELLSLQDSGQGLEKTSKS